MSPRILFIAACSFLLLSGCVQHQKPQYYTVGYSESLYAVRKNPCQETEGAHRQTLEKIVYESQVRNFRVPPGIYAEYGYILLKERKTDEGLKYLNLEMETYPESKIFVTRLIQFAQAREGKSEEKAVEESVAKEQGEPANVQENTTAKEKGNENAQ